MYRDVVPVRWLCYRTGTPHSTFYYRSTEGKRGAKPSTHTLRTDSGRVSNAHPNFLHYLTNRRIRDPYVRWCERRTPSRLSGGAVYSIGRMCFIFSSSSSRKCLTSFRVLIVGLAFKSSVNLLMIDFTLLSFLSEWSRKTFVT